MKSKEKPVINFNQTVCCDIGTKTQRKIHNNNQTSRETKRNTTLRVLSSFQNGTTN